MASGPIGRDDGTKEKQKPTERKVYTRKAFKGPKKDLNAANTIASAIAGSKIDNAATATEVAKDNSINKSIVQGSNADEAKSNSDNVLAQPPAPQQAVPEDGNLAAELVSSGLSGGNLAQPPEPQQVVPEDGNLTAQLQGSSGLEGGNSAQPQLEDQNKAQPLEPQQVVPEDGNLTAQPQGSSGLEGGILVQPHLQDQNTAQPPAQQVVLKDGNLTAQLQLEDQNTAQPLAPQQVVPGGGNLTAQPQGSLELEGGISAQPQLEDQNTAQPPAPQQVVLEDGNSETQLQVSLGSEGVNSAQLQLEDRNKAQLQVSLGLEGENLAQPQLEDQNTVQLQESSGLEDGNSAQPQLEDQNTTQLQQSSGLEDENSAQPQLDDQNKGQLQVRSELEGENLAYPQFEHQNTAQPQESSGLEDGNSTQSQSEDRNMVQPQLSLGLEDGNLAQPQESSGLEGRGSAQPQLEDQNMAQLQVSSGLEDGNLAQPLFEDQNMTQPLLEDENMTQSQVSRRMEDVDTAKVQVSSRLEDGNSARPQMTSRLEDGNSHKPQMDSTMEDANLPQPEDGDTAQAQVNSRLEDGNSPQPQVTSRLEDENSHQPQMDSIMEDANLPQPEMNLELEDRNSPQPGVDSRLEDQTSPQQQVNSRLEHGNLVQPPVVLVSDDSCSHQPEEPTSLNIQQEDNRPSSPGHQQEAVPSVQDLTSGNGAVEPRLKDRIKINLASKSKQEMQELRWKLESELDVVRSLVKRIEVKQRQVGGYGNLNILVRDRVGAKRAHSEVASAGVPRETTRPLNQLSFSMLENSQGISENVEKEKRTPKANQFYRNSEFLLAKDKFPPAESNKKSKSNWKKQAGGEMGHGFGMGSKFFKSCSSLLEKLMKHKHGWVFNAPVDVEGLGLHDYFTIITHPMDLGTVKSRLNKNWYKSPKEFAEDVRLTFRNAMTYNPKGQDVHVMAEQLSKIFEDRWAIIESDYNREMRYGFDYGAAPPAPSPMSRKVPAFTPPPLDMRRILDRSEPLTQTPRPMSITPSSRTPAPKKPKAKDPHKRDMTFEEKQKLSTNLQSLPSEKLDAIVQIIKKRNSALNQHDDEIEVDIDSVDAETLWELDRFVTNYKKSLSKNKRKAELARARAEALQNAMQKSQASAMLEIPKETQPVERNVPPSLPVQGGNQADNGSRSSSSSSSSSDSGSSSSDSDSDSSSASGSEAGSQGT